jgi:hypothetical protein
MDTFYKAQLPSGVTTLVDRIESFAKREISVEVDYRPRSPTSAKLTVSCLVNDEEVRSHVEECLRKEGGPVLLDEAKRFSARISEKLVSKPQAQSAVLRFLEIPMIDFMIVRFKASDGTLEQLRLPPH